jgi:hypothetical protein
MIIYNSLIYSYYELLPLPPFPFIRCCSWPVVTVRSSIDLLVILAPLQPGWEPLVRLVEATREWAIGLTGCA